MAAELTPGVAEPAAMDARRAGLPLRAVLFTILGGGAERVSASIVHSTAATVDWRVLAGSGTPEFFESRAVTILKQGERRGVLIELLRWIAGARRMVRLIDDAAPAVVLSSGFQGVLLLARALRLVRVPVLTLVHAPPSNDFTSTEFGARRRRLMRLAARLLLGRGDRYLALTDETAAELHDVYRIPREHIDVVPNFVDHAVIDAQRAAPLTPAEEALFAHPVVVTVGRLAAPKAQWHLLRAFRLVRESVPEARLLLVGDGPGRAALDDMAAHPSLAGAVTLHGADANPFRLVARSAVFALSSVREGFPMALLEAMACGVPVVACDCVSGPAALLGSGSAEQPPAGVLVPVCDGVRRSMDDPCTPEERALADALTAVLREPELRARLGAAARERSHDFSRDAVLPRIAAVLRRCADGGRR